MSSSDPVLRASGVLNSLQPLHVIYARRPFALTARILSVRQLPSASSALNVGDGFLSGSYTPGMLGQSSLMLVFERMIPTPGTLVMRSVLVPFLIRPLSRLKLPLNSI